jgi:hypothetical protein
VRTGRGVAGYGEGRVVGSCEMWMCEWMANGNLEGRWNMFCALILHAVCFQFGTNVSELKLRRTILFLVIISNKLGCLLLLPEVSREFRKQDVYSPYRRRGNRRTVSQAFYMWLSAFVRHRKSLLCLRKLHLRLLLLLLSWWTYFGSYGIGSH